MQRRARWRWPLIFTIILLTIYNILPTLFYYAQPLRDPLNEFKAQKAYHAIAERAEQLETDTLAWLRSYCNLVQVKPQSIAKDADVPQLVRIHCTTREEAERLRTYLPRAGSLIPFMPAQLTVLPDEEQSKTVTVLRKTALRFPEGVEAYFSFIPKFDEHGEFSQSYIDLVLDRAATIVVATAGESTEAQLLKGREWNEDQLLTLASEINEANELELDLKKRVFASFTRASHLDRKEVIERLIVSFEKMRDGLKLEKREQHQELLLARAEKVLKTHHTLFAAGGEPFTFEDALALLRNKRADLRSLNPFFEAVEIDWQRGIISLRMRDDIPDQLAVNEAARISQKTNETLYPIAGGYSIQLHQLQDVKGLIAFKVDPFLEQMQTDLIHLIEKEWHPKHPDLAAIPLVDEAGYADLPELKRQISLLFAHRDGNLTISFLGLDRIFSLAKEGPQEMQDLLQGDIRSLAGLLYTSGFYANPHYVFTLQDAFQIPLTLFREEFFVKGSRNYALLETSDQEQRLIVQNRIETKIHEDLLRWQDEYASAQISYNGQNLYDIPKPTKSPFWNNLQLSLRKLWRGDERKVLRWGLDLSGGKTVQIELHDHHGRVVTDPSDLKQGVNELFSRVNKMGVSDVSIRQLGNTIVLDFPSSQALSAKELITASSMSFHVVNEKFSRMNRDLADTANRFLQEVWNEALVTNRKDSESINVIAWSHLIDGRTESARVLKEHGLRLAAPKDQYSCEVDEELSRIVLFRGDGFRDWQNQAHPLLIVFNNYALEGSDLQNIHTSFDPSKGNALGFEIASSAREHLYSWTSRFSQEGIGGTDREQMTGGHGWRMAVVLNDSVISSPNLQSSLRDSAMISGHFSQREIQQLVSDLKAGSLTFTPSILSEKNVSPELGSSDRLAGIVAMGVCLLFVIAAMIGYYYYAGLVASAAVLFNLLILWAALQNMQATLSLAGIAGIILTVAMAVDANVLVFERMKEELAITRNISMALEAGYKRAFSAIFDSNVTTIIAALILLNFDAGPIKGFAMTLIIGIVSSLFTALFMTRTYFSWWARRKPHKKLRMSHWVRSSSINFLKKSRIAFGVVGAITLIGGSLFFSHRQTILGMDFTGGFAGSFELEKHEPSFDYATAVSQALIAQGISAQDFQVRALTPENHLRVLFSSKIDRPELQQWMLSSLEGNGLLLTKESRTALDQNWSAVTGQMSDTMRNNAIIGLLLAFASIFVYLMIRFETTFAVASLLCLAIELVVTLGFMGILHACGLPVQIDLNTIAALMTIIGYCLNDIIIIFDRIREELHRGRVHSFAQVINGSLNATLGRTAITSGITFFVLLILVFMGGPTLLSFALIMAIGVFIGTLSSWFIASSLLLYLQRRKLGLDPSQG